MVSIGTWDVIGLVVGSLLLVGLVIWLVRRRYRNSDSTGNDDTGEQRQRAYEERENRDVPLRTRAMKTPLEAKVGGAVAFVTLAIVIYEVYSFMKTGTPSQVATAWQTKFVAASSAAFAVGIWYERRRRANKEGRIDVTYEARPWEGEDEKVVTYYFDPRDTIHTKHGPVMFEREENRKFGLFRMPKLHGDDRRFKDVEDPRPPGDKIGLELPSHHRQVGQNHYAFRTKDYIVLDSAQGEGDIQYLPPHNKSREQELQRQTDIDNLQTRVQELQHRNAELEVNQRSQREEEKNEIDRILDDMERVLSKLRPMLQNQQSQIEITEENHQPSRSSRETNGRDDNGTGPKPPAATDGRGGGR